MVVDLSRPEPNSPEWWVRVLMAALETRRIDMERWVDYYENRHPLTFFDNAVRERFGHRFGRFASNFTALVVDGLTERYEVQGFRFSDAQGDEDVWKLWQENQLDAWSQQAHTDAFVKGCTYTLIEPNGGEPRITVEDAMNTIIAHDPRNSRHRLAGLKRWIEPSSGKLVVVVYMPDFIYKYRSIQAWPNNGAWTLNPFPNPTWTINGPGLGDWTINSDDNVAKAAPVTAEAYPAGGLEPYNMGDDEWPLPNPLGVVPMVRLSNRPSVSGEFSSGRSEIQPIASNQDLINYYRAMSVVAARYLAMPQRFALNLETEIDPNTGQPKAPFRGGLADLWVVPPMDEDDPRALQAGSQVSLGQFASADLSPYIDLIDKEVKAMAAISRMPYAYLMDQGTVPPTGESTTAGEAALVRKVRGGRVFLGEGWEETMRVALLAKGDNKRAGQMSAEVIWANPQTMNLAVVTDSVTKQRQEGLIDDDTARDILGYSPQQQRRIRDAMPLPIPIIMERVGGTGGLTGVLPTQGEQPAVTITPANGQPIPAAQGSQPVAMATRPRKGG